MSIKKIISEAVSKNPTAMKEALETLLSQRIAEAIDAKREEMGEEADMGEASEYNKDSVEKAINSADKNSTKKTSGKKKALIHSLLKGHSKKNDK